MSYSHLRLRRTLAVVRVLIGVLFLVLSAHKISSWEFAKVEFPQFIHGAVVGFYGDFLSSLVESHPSGIAVLVALTELFIGVGLVLGLAVRPISLLGMIYTANLMLATCMAPAATEGGLWRYLDNETKLITLFFLFLLLDLGHTGENWGLGSLYHRHRSRRWEQNAEAEDESSSDVKAESYSERYKDELQGEVAPDWELDQTSGVTRMKR